MPTRLRLSCRALLITVLLTPSFYSAGPRPPTVPTKSGPDAAGYQSAIERTPTSRVVAAYRIVLIAMYNPTLTYCSLMLLSTQRQDAGLVGRQATVTRLHFFRVVGVAQQTGRRQRQET